MHNLQLTEDQELIVDTVRKFVTDVVAPKAQEHDEHRTFARAEFDGLAELGVFGLCTAEDHGGAGMGFVPFVAALEAVGAHSASLASLWIGQVQATLAVEVAGGSLDDLVAGSKLAAFVGPEHGIRLANGALTGGAELVPGAAEADLLVVAARDGDKAVLALVSGCRGTPLRGLGLASAGCGRVAFGGGKVEVLATGEVAERAIARARLAGWLGTAAVAVGGATASVQASRKHASERIAFGKPLLVQEAVQRKLVESQRQSDGARQLTWHAARLADLGQDATDVALQARLSAVEAVVLAADEAIQIHGGFGYTVEYHVERHYRDGKTLEVLDGGAEALRTLLGARQFA